MDSHVVRQLLGGIATAIALYSNVPYVVDIFRGKTRPHVIRIGFAGQVSDGGGAGTWVIGFSGVASTIIFLLALRYGEKLFTRGDWCCLSAALSAIPLWLITSAPLWSMILISPIDVIGFLPTIRKSYAKPFEETALVYSLGL